MPNPTTGPYGFLPIGLQGGQVYAGNTRLLPIVSGYAKNIGFGDFVTLISTGYINRVDSGTGAIAAWATNPIGIFLGCSYTDPNLKYKVFRQSWPTGTAAADAFAIVADDPDLLFKAAVGNASAVVLTASGVQYPADLGSNIGYFIKAPATGFVDGVNTATGNAATVVNYASVAATKTLPLRIVDVVPESVLSDGTYSEVILSYVNLSDTVGHAYRVATGI
jgi:hypothetical protein